MKQLNGGRKVAEYAVFAVSMLGGAFLPGFVIGVFVAAVLAVIHAAG